jgi:hypothetical protein
VFETGEQVKFVENLKEKLDHVNAPIDRHFLHFDFLPLTRHLQVCQDQH